MTKTSEIWYKKPWGIVLVILILPYFLLWYMWAKTNWSKKTKWIVTGVAAIFFIIALAGSGSYQSGVSQNNQIAKQPDTQVKQTEASNSGTKPAVELLNVAKVVDGDTLDIEKIGRIRLIGIDTPETVDPRKPVQCFGQEASNKAKELLSGKKVSLESDSVNGDKDSYGRSLRYVFLEDGTNFNKMMITEGYAHQYTYNGIPYKYQSEFIEAEKQARDSGKGLWSASTCNGDTEKAAGQSSTQTNLSTSTNTQTTNSQPVSTEGPQVKKSTTGICHAKGTTYYTKTQNYTPYNSVEECLASGGRLPKR